MKVLSINRSKIFDILCITSIYILSLHIIFSSIIFQVVASILILPFLFKKIRHISYSINGMIPYIVYLVISLVFSIFNIFFTSNGIGGCLILISTLTLGLYCIDNINKLRIHILLILIINIFYILYKILYLMQDPNEIFEGIGLSRNHGGLLLCLFTGFYCYIKKISCGSVSIIMPLISMITAYLLVGRSSFGLLGALFIVSLIARNKNIGIIFLSLLTIVILYYFKTELELLYEASSFAEHGMESARYEIWSSYIENLSLKSLIFGVDTEIIPILRDYGGNPHNSFFNFHRRMGLIPLILFVSISTVAIIKYILNNQLYLVFILFIIYSRIFFDSDCFIGPFDYILYTIAFYPIFKYKSIFRIPDYRLNSVIKI